jgi:hypothetical protein
MRRNVSRIATADEEKLGLMQVLSQFPALDVHRI